MGGTKPSGAVCLKVTSGERLVQLAGECEKEELFCGSRLPRLQRMQLSVQVRVASSLKRRKDPERGAEGM